MARMVTPEFWSDEDSSGGNAVYWIYCISEQGGEVSGPCKVGIATNLSKRLSSLQGGNWRKLSLVWKIRLGSRREAKETEGRLLFRYRPSIYARDDRALLESEWVEAEPRAVLAQAVEYLNITHQPIQRVA